MRRLALLVGAALLAGGCGGHSTARRATAPATARLAFAYPATAPLRFVDRGVVRRDGTVAVHDVSYESGGRRVQAYLLERGGARGEPGVVVVHGSGGDRGELLAHALELARGGAVAILPTMPSERPQPPPASVAQLLDQSRAAVVGDVIAVRRAADVLASLPAVDPHRLGYLGWSAGAKTGTFVAATDRRFDALVLLSAGAARLGSFVAAAPPVDRGLVRRRLGLVDPIRYVAHARPHTLLLADGRRDTVVPHAALENIVQAAPPGTTVRWYDAGHALNARAWRDAARWLLGRLHAS
jgi:dienelactone hydrolase